MKRAYLFLIPCIVSISAAFFLLINDKGGWGWFLFIGICTFIYPAARDDKED